MASATTSTGDRKRWLFVDANIYLSFFRTSAKDIRKLLPSLLEIKNNIFVTRQIRDEVQRNKLGVTLASLQPVREKVRWREWNLPDLLEAKFGRGGPKWADDAKADADKVNAAIDSVLSDVATSGDVVSRELQPIFEQVRNETPEELESARFRREIGNPPGKTKDTLGDQISWTQLLSTVTEKDEVWIVTSDGDFHVRNGESILLNPFLLKELTGKGVHPTKVHVHDNLASALQAFSKAAEQPVKSLPTEKVLESAAREEKETEWASVAVPVGSGDLWRTFPSGQLFFPEGGGKGGQLFSMNPKLGSPGTSPFQDSLVLIEPAPFSFPTPQRQTGRAKGSNPWFPPKPPPPIRRGGKKKKKRK
jgi:hypothetical protein